MASRDLIAGTWEITCNGIFIQKFTDKRTNFRKMRFKFIVECVKEWFMGWRHESGYYYVYLFRKITCPLRFTVYLWLQLLYTIEHRKCELSSGNFSLLSALSTVNISFIGT